MGTLALTPNPLPQERGTRRRDLDSMIVRSCPGRCAGLISPRPLVCSDLMNPTFTFQDLPEASRTYQDLPSTYRAATGEVAVEDWSSRAATGSKPHFPTFHEEICFRCRYVPISADSRPYPPVWRW